MCSITFNLCLIESNFFWSLCSKRSRSESVILLEDAFISSHFSTIYCSTSSKINFIGDAENGVDPDAQESSNDLFIGTSPSYGSNPTISGTPEPDEDITAVDVVPDGTPTPTAVNEFYIGGVATGVTNTVITLQAADVGKSIERRNTASNPIESGVVVVSNSLDIVSGFEIFPAPYTAGYFHYHAGETPFGNALDMRVVTTEQANGYDEFGKYDTASHNSFQTAQGGGTVFTPKLYDSKGLYDNVQLTEGNQPSVDNDGTVNWGLTSNTRMIAPIPLSSTDGFSCAFVLNIPAVQVNFDYLITTGTPNRVSMQFLADGQMRVTIDGKESFIDPNIYGVGWKVITIVARDDANVSFKVNDIEQTHNSDSFGPIVNPSTEILFYNDSNGGQDAICSSREEVIYDGVWTDQQVTDIVTWFTDAGSLT